MSDESSLTHEQADVVVIGAGLTGLTYGNVAATKGYQVAAVEQHFKAGGYATNFARMRRKIHFDCSLHKITGLGPNGNLRDALLRAGLWQRLSFHMYRDLTAIVIGDQRYQIPANYDDAKLELHRCFPDDRDGLDRLFADIESHGYQNYMVARMALGEYRLNEDLLAGSRRLSHVTAKQYFRSIFRHPHLTIIFSSVAINLGVVADEIDALYFLHFAYTFFVTGAGYVKGTSQTLSDTLAASLVERGGKLHLSEKVRRIEVREGKVAAVVTERRRIETAEVVATCSPHAVAEMLEPGALGPHFQEKLGRLRFGLGHFTVYAVLKEPAESLGLVRSEYILAPQQDSALGSDDVSGDQRYLEWPLEITNYHLLDPNGGPLLQMTILDHRAQWFELSKEEYKREKERVQGLLLRRVLDAFPTLADQFTYLESSTPRTNFRYTGSPDGSAFGYRATPGRNLRFLRGAGVSGLRFVGTWVVGAGYEPAICLGFTEAFLRPDKPISKPSEGHQNV